MKLWLKIIVVPPTRHKDAQSSVKVVLSDWVIIVLHLNTNINIPLRDHKISSPGLIFVNPIFCFNEKRKCSDLLHQKPQNILILLFLLTDLEWTGRLGIERPCWGGWVEMVWLGWIWLGKWGPTKSEVLCFEKNDRQLVECGVEWDELSKTHNKVFGSLPLSVNVTFLGLYLSP